MQLAEFLIQKIVGWIDTIMQVIKQNFFAGDGKFNQLFVYLLFGLIAAKIFKIKMNLGQKG
jgi:hypothetical protein